MARQKRNLLYQITFPETQAEMDIEKVEAQKLLQTAGPDNKLFGDELVFVAKFFPNSAIEKQYNTGASTPKKHGNTISHNITSCLDLYAQERGLNQDLFREEWRAKRKNVLGMSSGGYISRKTAQLGSDLPEEPTLAELATARSKFTRNTPRPLEFDVKLGLLIRESGWSNGDAAAEIQRHFKMTADSADQLVRNVRQRAFDKDGTAVDYVAVKQKLMDRRKAEVEARAAKWQAEQAKQKAEEDERRAEGARRAEEARRREVEENAIRRAEAEARRMSYGAFGFQQTLPFRPSQNAFGVAEAQGWYEIRNAPPGQLTFHGAPSASTNAFMPPPPPPYYGETGAFDHQSMMPTFQGAAAPVKMRLASTVAANGSEPHSSGPGRAYQDLHTTPTVGPATSVSTVAQGALPTSSSAWPASNMGTDFGSAGHHSDRAPHLSSQLPAAMPVPQWHQSNSSIGGSSYHDSSGRLPNAMSAASSVNHSTPVPPTLPVGSPSAQPSSQVRRVTFAPMKEPIPPALKNSLKGLLRSWTGALHKKSQGLETANIDLLSILHVTMGLGPDAEPEETEVKKFEAFCEKHDKPDSILWTELGEREIGSSVIEAVRQFLETNNVSQKSFLVYMLEHLTGLVKVASGDVVEVGGVRAKLS